MAVARAQHRETQGRIACQRPLLGHSHQLRFSKKIVF
jgi:hypothetical protein